MVHHADHDRQLQPRLAGYGRRTRVAVALISLLVGLGIPAAVLSAPVPTVDGHPVGALADPAGLGVTGAPPGDALSTNAASGVVPTTGPDGVPTDPASAGLPGIPTPPDLPDGPLGIPGVVLDAYQFAQRTLTAVRPGCHLSWSVLAGIGRIESDHASDGRVDTYGNTLGPILGPRLDGSPGVAAIPDTDHGVLDGDTVWDRAVGPMQFIPSSWRIWSVDGNGDGVANPNNIYDSTVATGLYLCAGGADLSDPAQLQAAIFGYNHSATYVDVVLQWAHAYLTGVVPTASAPGPVPPGTNGNGGVAITPDPSQAAAGPRAAAQVVTLAAAPAHPSPPASASPLVTATSAVPTTSVPSPSPTTATAPPTPSPSEAASPDPAPGSLPPGPPSATPAVASTTAPVEPGSTLPSPPSPTPAPAPAPSPSPTPSPSPAPSQSPTTASAVPAK